MVLDKGIICGVDEAGRGALAGPVVAASVVLDPYLVPSVFKDSKTLTEDDRDKLYELLCDSESLISVGILSHHYIDRHNILKATLEAMKRSILGLELLPNKVLIDGNKAPHMPELNIQTIVKGDQIEPAISAASIVAKVTRDRIMKQLGAKFPRYGFASNKGYGTKAHYDAIFEVGLSGAHRKTFNLSRQETLFAA